MGVLKYNQLGGKKTGRSRHVNLIYLGAIRVSSRDTYAAASIVCSYKYAAICNQMLMSSLQTAFWVSFQDLKPRGFF